MDDNDRLGTCFIKPVKAAIAIPDVMKIMVQEVTNAAAQMHELLKEHRVSLPTELPNKLPPEMTVFFTISLTEGAVSPLKNLNRLSRPELEEVSKQVKALR